MKTIIDIIKEHIEWRKQIFKLAKADIIKTYSGAALGWAWALVKPVVTIFVFWFAFDIGLGLGGSVKGYPFVLWLIAGYIPWFYMSEMITQGANSIRKYRYLVTKMKFPVSTIPTFVGLSKFTVHVCLMAIVIVVYAMFGFLPDIYYLQIPVYMLLMLIFFIIWSLFSSMLSSISNDFLNLVKAFVTPIFWMSGIMWDINGIDIGWLKTILLFNPVTYLVTGFRNSFVYKIWIWERPYEFIYFVIVLTCLLALAIWSYNKLRKEIPDVL